jgi:hypothetical protein
MGKGEKYDSKFKIPKDFAVLLIRLYMQAQRWELTDIPKQCAPGDCIPADTFSVSVCGHRFSPCHRLTRIEPSVTLRQGFWWRQQSGDHFGKPQCRLAVIGNLQAVCFDLRVIF